MQVTKMKKFFVFALLLLVAAMFTIPAVFSFTETRSTLSANIPKDMERQVSKETKAFTIVGKEAVAYKGSSTHAGHDLSYVYTLENDDGVRHITESKDEAMYANVAIGDTVYECNFVYQLSYWAVFGTEAYSPYDIYHDTFVLSLSEKNFGTLTSTRLEIRGLFFGKQGSKIIIDEKHSSIFFITLLNFFLHSKHSSYLLLSVTTPVCCPAQARDLPCRRPAFPPRWDSESFRS